MGDTSISWTDKSWNPGQGCSRVSEGCRNCYAERLAARFAESGWSKGLINLKTKKWNGTVRLAPHKLAEPLSWRKPARVFVNSMTDLFHDGYSNEEIAAVFGVMAAAPQHTFQILTKRAKRMREWFEWLDELIESDAVEDSGAECSLSIHDARDHCRAFQIALAASRAISGQEIGEEQGRAFDCVSRHIDPEGAPPRWPLPNVWLGVSVENQEAADERIPELLNTPAAIRFLSCEPLLAHVTLAGEHDDSWLSRLNWVIAGCESGPGARECEVAWLRSLRDQCAAARVAFFLKQAVETDLGRCGDSDNPNGDAPCGERITAYVRNEHTAGYSCGCTIEGSEDGAAPELGAGEGSKRKGGRVIELPYLDGVQHAAFPEPR